MRCTSCTSIVRPVVAIDIDGTLAQYHLNYAQFVEKYDDRPAGTLPRDWDGRGEFGERLGLSVKEHHDRKLAFRAGGHKRWMQPFRGASEMMNLLRKMDIEIWVTTTRPWMRMDNVDTDTVEWLRRNNVPYDHLLFDKDKYSRLMELVDHDRIIVVLDDEVEQRDRCVELRLPFVLSQTVWNRGISGGTGVSDLMDMVPIVEERLGFHNALQH